MGTAWFAQVIAFDTPPSMRKLGMVYRESSNLVRALLTSFRNTSYDSVFWLMVCSLPPH
jgi:hypothetical protein